MSVRSLKSLGEYVLARRGELDLTQEEFAARGGIHTKTLQRIERGEITPRAKTIGAIDRAADWESGSARGILTRGDPPRPRKAEDAYVIRDDFERQIMELDTLPEQERWRFIFAHRQRHQAAQQSDTGSALG